MDLLKSTFDLVHTSRLTNEQIAKGAKVNLNWLLKFKQSRIKEPGVKKIQRLYNFLISTVENTSPARTGCDESTHAD